MHKITIFLGALLLASQALAASPLAVSFQKSGVRPDAEARKLLRSRSSVSLDLANQYGVQYNINLTIGTPPQRLGVQLDTGSSNFWVPAARAPVCADDGCYLGAYRANKSSTYKYVNSEFDMQYYDPSDYDAGDYITDNVGINGVTIKNISLGVAYDAVDAVGVLGIGLTYEEEGTYEPTLVDLMKSQGLIDRRAYSIYLNDLDTNSGTILFGGEDTTKYTGHLISLPMQPDYSTNVSDFSVSLTNVTMVDGNLNTHRLSPSNFTAVPACLDSGTYDMQLPTSIANAIIQGMGAVYYDDWGAYVVPCKYAQDTTVTFIFNFGGPEGPNIFVPLKEMLTDADFKFENGEEACILGIEPVDTELGGIVLLGDTFMRSTYLVYDLDNLQIAMAQANYDVFSSNVVNIPSGTRLPGVTATATAKVNTKAWATLTAAASSQIVSTLVPASPTFILSSGLSSSSSGVGLRVSPVFVSSYVYIVMGVVAGTVGIAAVLL